MTSQKHTVRVEEALFPFVNGSYRSGCFLSGYGEKERDRLSIAAKHGQINIFLVCVLRCCIEGGLDTQVRARVFLEGGRRMKGWERGEGGVV